MPTTIETKHGAIQTVAITRSMGPLVIATRHGSASAPANQALDTAAAAASTAGRECEDIDRSLAGPWQKADLKRQVTTRHLPPIEKAGQTVDAACKSLAARIAASTAPHSFAPTTPYWNANEMHELGRVFANMPPAQRATTLHAATFETSEIAQTWSRALQAVTPALTGITPQQRVDLAVASFARRDPAAFKAMSVEIQQVASAKAGMGRIADYIASVIGARMDFSTGAPTAALLAAEPTPSWGASERVLASLEE